MVDPDVKAYFQSVSTQITSLTTLARPSYRQQHTNQDDDDEDTSTPLSDLTALLTSAFTELLPLTLTLSTDHDTSLILEQIFPLLNDEQLVAVGEQMDRDFGEGVGSGAAGRRGGNWARLVEQRFGSHVVQCFVECAMKVIEKDPSNPSSESLINNLTSLTHSLHPPLPTLLNSPFASPVLRTLLLAFSADRPLPSAAASRSAGEGTNVSMEKMMRSKRSKKFRSDHLAAEGGTQASTSPSTGINRNVPRGLLTLRTEIRHQLTKRLSGAEWRAVGIEKAGGVVVQMLLEFEKLEGESLREGSILDHLTSGLVAEQIQPNPPEPTPQDYLPSLLRDTTGSHLLQAILLHAPYPIFPQIWSMYFTGKLGKLGGHPIGNFVVASGVERLEREGVEGVVRELEIVGVVSLINLGRTAVLKALVERSTAIGAMQQEVVALICKAFELETYPEKKTLVMCGLTLNVYKAYDAAVKAHQGIVQPEAEEKEPEEDEQKHGWKARQPKKEKEALEMSMQGALLIQSMFEMDAPANELIANSLLAQKVDDIISMAHTPIGSHVLDAFLLSTKIAAKFKRKFLLSLIGKYFELVDDRFGSRVGDTIWDKAADGFMKEKIARSLLPQTIALGNSEFGRFFYKKLNLPLLERRANEWRELQLKVVHHSRGSQLNKEKFAKSSNGNGFLPGTPAAPGQDGEEKLKKRKREDGESKGDAEGAVIDELFAPMIKSKKSKKSAVTN